MRRSPCLGFRASWAPPGGRAGPLLCAVRGGSEPAGGTHQAPAAGSGGSAPLLAGSSSVLRRKDGHTCTCLSTLLLISSKVDMAATCGQRACLTVPVITSDATLSSAGGVTGTQRCPLLPTGSNPLRAADLLSPSPATPQVRAPQTRMTRTELVSRETQAGGRQAQAPFLTWHEESPCPRVTSRLLQAGCCVVAQLLRQYRPLEQTGAVAPQPTLCRRGVGPARGTPSCPGDPALGCP